MQSSNDVNILLLGEAGVGKSTWINGLANYFKYNTLEEAERDGMVCLIPINFEMTNENYESTRITIGKDVNEVDQPGQSATQLPVTYVCKHDGMNFRFIDTPGMGDTRGIEQDRINMQNIMTHLSNYEHINGIWILLKPNNTRLSVTFTFCIKELLTHLHRDACKNMTFCFTGTSAYNFRPGDTLPALRKLLSENNDVEIELSRDTMYCVDNDSIRYLAAVRNQYNISPTEKDRYERSWLNTVEEIGRLCRHTASLKSHALENTLSLNEARRLILNLSRPIAEICDTIQSGIEVVKERKVEVQNSFEEWKQLEKELYIPVIDLEMEKLGHPRTVCTSPRCVEHVVVVGSVTKTDYVSHCHPHCLLTGVPSDSLDCEQLMQCEAMDGDGICKICKCPWRVHMHITYVSQKVEKRTTDEKVKKKMRSNASKRETMEAHLTSLDERIRQLEHEKKELIQTSAKFASFLKKFAITPYNDALADYTDHLIEIQKARVDLGGNKSILQGLEKMREAYQEEIALIENASRQDEDAAALALKTPEDVQKAIRYLYGLEIIGSTLRNAELVAKRSAIGAAKLKEKSFESDIRRGPSAELYEHRVQRYAGINHAQSGSVNTCTSSGPSQSHAVVHHLSSAPSESASSWLVNMVSRLWAKPQ